MPWNLTDLVSPFVSKASSEGTELCCRKSFLSKTGGKRVGFWSCPLLWHCKETSIKLQGMLKCWAKLQFSLFGYKWISRYMQTQCYVNVGTGPPLTAHLCWPNCHGLLMSSVIINSHIWYKDRLFPCFAALRFPAMAITCSRLTVTGMSSPGAARTSSAWSCPCSTPSSAATRLGDGGACC